jgi:hypothetical protein
MALKLAGNNFNYSIESTKSFGNPLILDTLITNLDIYQHGSNFPKEVFDPQGIPAQGFYDELAADVLRRRDRKSGSDREFVSSGYQVEAIIN